MRAPTTSNHGRSHVPVHSAAHAPCWSAEHSASSAQQVAPQAGVEPRPLRMVVVPSTTPGMRDLITAAVAVPIPAHNSRPLCSAKVRFEQKKQALQKEARQKEWHRQERRELEADALLAATRAASNATRRLQEPLECAACGQAEACMMHLPCHHVALCQRCFDTTWQSNAPCARCGTASHISLRVRRA
mmetsp:Transcript_19240/g.48370  ORF Transcript_19240/g.48370 Transcript_19240/m.48370 type:complete len:188 (-) Transcript_19240:95-658(-)